ncbi:MAG TPA: ABC transporter ATP-binding protein [Luteitalea sp.]|nr:ABC transporter ATP-binding protein [Luteitalea sp.]
MREGAQPAVAVEHVGRAFRIHPTDRARLAHAAWSGVARLPGLSAWGDRRRAPLAATVAALDDVSFTVRRGESVGVIGANGSGKSTLLHVVCGTLHATSGTVRTDGRIAALLELGTGFSPDLTGRENIRLSGLLHGLDEATIASRSSAIAAFADIGPYLDQPVRTYSSGMYVRLAFAVMAHVDADVLIVDEALAVGDIRFVQKCLAHLERFRSGGGTLLFVSHDLPAVQRLCSRVLWLDGGRLRRDGDPREVTEAYFDSMIGSPVVDGAVTMDAHGGATEGSISSPATAAPGEARIGDVFLRLADADVPVRTARGGERVTLVVTIDGADALQRPIVGFYVKDRFGQQLFGENTLATSDAPAPRDGRLTACFTFVMPRLFPGEYLIAVAVADGTQADHLHHEWRHEAWHFTSMWPGGATGLVGIEVGAAWGTVTLAVRASG